LSERFMRTEVLHVDRDKPDATLIRQAAVVLRRGGLVAFPTETVYGLGANALDRAAVGRIFAAKGRPPSNPLIVHTASALAARNLLAAWPEKAQRLAERFWPGPLTLVLPRTEIIPDIVTGGGPTVAVRVPAHPVALALLCEAGVPLAAPSANRSTGLSPTRAEHVIRDLEGLIELVLDGGPTPGGLESTVLDLTVAAPRLLRAGLIAPAEIEAVIGPIRRPAEGEMASAARPLPSPGMLHRHYAPRTPLDCIGGDAWPLVQELCRQGLRVGWLKLAGAPGKDLPGLVVVSLAADPADYAARLYAVLHDLDTMGLDRIVVDLPPATEEWLAVRDRLQRAAAKAGPPG
jgi:L-threonylcarbamoyladenylate synthase